MKKVLVLGAGMVARPLVRYLLDKGYDVTIRDLRFYSPNEKTPGFVTDIVLDKDLHVLSESFGFAARKRTTFD